MSRASPLPPNERRAEIMAATEKLILSRGGTVSTNAIARAAGIAEGTIFRVFPTKEAIIDAIFKDAFNPDARRAELATIDLSADLETRMIETVRIMQRRIRRILALFAAVGFRRPPGTEARRPLKPELDYAELAVILEPDSERLGVPPIEAARLLLGVVMAMTSPMFAGRGDTAPEEIVNLLLNGIARPGAAPPSRDLAC
jgi:AcrR family transcriptional regulator